MDKEKDIRRYVRPILDKLPGIRTDLVRLDDKWQKLRLTPPDGNPGRRDKGRDPLIQAKQESGKHGPCVNGKSEEQKSVDCDNIKVIAYRRNYFICLTTSNASTVPARGTEMWNADAPPAAKGVISICDEL